MLKEIFYFQTNLSILVALSLFSICKLFGQEKAVEPLSWSLIIEDLNGLEDINDTSKIKRLAKVSDLIAQKLDSPTKENILTIKTNRLKLALANILIEKKKYLWVEEIYRQIDARKLDNLDCRLLFEMETLSLLRYPDRDISTTLLDSLKFLIKKCPNELKEKPGHLYDLYQFYIHKQLLNEALIIAEILWEKDEYHFHCGELHQRAYRLRWESKNTTHWEQSKNHFEIIEKDFPNSKFILESLANIIILQTEFDPTSNIAELIKIKLFPNIEQLSEEKVGNLLDALTNKAKDPEIIQLIKNWHDLLVNKKASMQKRETIISFLNEKCGLNINELAIFLKNGNLINKTFPLSLQNASIHKKIQYLVYWNSEWEPIADFKNSQTDFRYDPLTKTSLLVCQNNQKHQIIFAYERPVNQILPDYIYVEINNLTGQNSLDISFHYDNNTIEVDKIICTNEKKLIRIAVNEEIKKAKNWQIEININSKLNASLLEISAPTFLKIKNISELDKKIGE